ncbi:MAG: hypothetical protein U0547_04450 [Dehalococcoidia bacterium]
MRSRALIAIAGTAVTAALVASAATAFGVSRSNDAEEPTSFALSALGNTFTFQGALDDGGSPANGAYDFRFIMYDDGVGGSQVGPAVTVNDLAVSGGIFTAPLDFGAVFQGDNRWIEVQVRAGASSGSYTTLSPRQAITATPYALYSRNLAFGSSMTGTTTTGLTINQNATGANGIVVNMDNATNGVGLFAMIDETSGTAVGVEGVASSAGGAGGSFMTMSTSGTGLRATGNGADSTALQIGNGAIKLTGSTRPAFEWTATAASITGHVTVIDHPLLNNNPNAIVIFSQLWEGVYNDHPTAIYYNSGRWKIFNEDFAAMPNNAKFNILVFDQ